ncbi:MAG: NUDIX domain-containing protein [Candidatus Omnitrophota bacterium]
MLVTRDELFNLIEKVKFRIRILGAVSFDLPYERYKKDWLERINKGELQVEIICESEPSLSYSSLISANKKASGEERSYDIGTFLNKKVAPEKKIRDFLSENNCLHIEPEEDAFKDFLKKKTKEEQEQIKKERNLNQFDMSPFKQFFSLRTCFLHIPIPIINIDDDYYITQALTRFCTQEKFEKITRDNFWFEEYQKYFHAYFDSPLGASKYSSEITAKDNKTEIIVFYNDKRQVLGQLPRDSFLDSSKVKLVIWGMIFTREGKVLIHKRGANAKDNRDLWDKSIGGHVDLEKDVVDTVKAAAREMLEELYIIEQEAQGGHRATQNMQVNENKPIFLGEWRPEIRYTFPFSEINKKKDEYFFFRMNYDFSKKVVDSPRLLPDGNELPVKAFVDLYVFVVPQSFSTLDLQNSKYLLVETHELYDSYLDGEILYEGKPTPFKATPDLKKIITGDIWIELNSFADYLKDGLNN